MGEPMSPEEAWDRALEAAIAECLKNADRCNSNIGARNCYEIVEDIRKLKGKLHEDETS